MLIALMDWIRYKCGIGHYSTSKLEGLGAFKATPDTFKGINARVAYGDSLFVHSKNSFVGWAIMYVTHGSWNHVGILTGRGTVLEAIGAGTGEYDFSKYFDGQHYLMIVRVPITPEQRQAAETFVNVNQGNLYDYWGIVRILVTTLVNEHADYRLTFTIDIMIVLFVICLIPVTPVRIVAVVAGTLYLLVLGINSFNRLRAALRLYDDYLEFASPNAQLPANSSPNRVFRRLARVPGVGRLQAERVANDGDNPPSSNPA
jgi:hypothetical protein